MARCPFAPCPNKEGQRLLQHLLIHSLNNIKLGEYIILISNPQIYEMIFEVPFGQVWSY